VGRLLLPSPRKQQMAVADSQLLTVTPKSVFTVSLT
jgi:hypothetical protein